MSFVKREEFDAVRLKASDSAMKLRRAVEPQVMPFRDLVAHDALARLERFKECAGLFLKVSCEALEAELNSKGHAPTTHQRERMAVALSAALMSFVFVPETAPSKGALRDHAATVAVKIVGEIFHG